MIIYIFPYLQSIVYPVDRAGIGEARPGHSRPNWGFGIR